MIKNTFRLLLLIILFGAHISSLWAMTINEFTKESYQQIVAAHKDNAFIMVLWSIDCPPCYEELQQLGEYITQHKKTPLVLISTDTMANMADIENMLTESHLQNQQLWLFADRPANQLRYSIDSQWYGELPRSYLFNQCHQRKAISGKINMTTVEQFLTQSPCPSSINIEAVE